VSYPTPRLQTARELTVSFITVVPFFRVTEKVPLGAGSSSLGRRDLRPGRQTARASLVPEGVLVEMTWPEPMPGEDM
jgi:hypothetical protein